MVEHLFTMHKALDKILDIGPGMSQRWMNLCEVEASMVYIVSSMQPGIHREKKKESAMTEKKNQKKKHLWILLARNLIHAFYSDANVYMKNIIF